MLVRYLLQVSSPRLVIKLCLAIKTLSFSVFILLAFVFLLEFYNFRGAAALADSQLMGSTTTSPKSFGINNLDGKLSLLVE